MRYDTQTKRFFAAVLSLILLLLACTITGAFLQRNEVRKILTEHDKAVVSSLLEQGVSPQVTAKAITSETQTTQGAVFLNKLGLSDKADVRFLPAVREFTHATGAFTAVWLILFSALLLTAVILFLRSRENLYKAALKTICGYTRGDFSPLLPQTHNGTVYRLFAQINTMATALKSKLEAEADAKEFLKNTVSDISHQLKTPLAALSMYNEIILSEPNHPDTVTAFTQKSQSAVSRMEQLIKSLLKLTRLDAGGIEFHNSAVSAHELITLSAAELTDRAKRENKEIQMNGNKNDTVYCDLAWTREAVGNIIKNALDHTSSGGIINIGWEQTPLMLRISVTDDGKGIAPEDFHHIFKRFYRSKNSLDTAGAGLGLPLAKSIIEGQGGTITVQSRRGEGTAFVLAFPAGLTKM